tara:strand:+ start:11087 stop:13243 length:2157 start_codon:yes stop_codon:yes gene_type:complete
MPSAFSSTSLKKHPGLDEWVSVGEDGRIAIHTGKVDIGQRISTALAIIAAEELDVDMSRIDVIRTVTGEAPDEGITSGSNSMMESGSAVRLASATARAHLLARAADRLGVDIDTLETDDGLIQSRGTNQSVTYQELQGGIPFGLEVDPDIAVKSPGDHRLVGRHIAPLGLSDIVAGKYTYLHDMKMPGMLHARVVRPPHYHARLRGMDEALADRLRDGGIRIVRDGSYLAVAGADEYAVIRAAERLFAGCDWDTADGITQAELFESITGNERISLPVENDGVPQDKPVPPLEEPEGAAHTLNARYDKPYHSHGSIGPSAGAALWQEDGMQVWSHSQGIYFLRSAIAEAFGQDEQFIRIEHVPGAGCYGHNGADDAAFDAALIARALPGTPILLKWTREEEHSWAPYATAMSLKLQASLDADGKVMAWSHESYGDTFSMRPRSGPNMAGAARLLSSRFTENPPPPFVAQPSIARHIGLHRNLDPLYRFPNKRLVKNLVRGLPLRTSALRTLGAFGNVFALESFMDELAEAAGINPVTFRLNHLEDPRGRKVLETLARHIDLTADDERGRGIGFAQYKNLKAYAAVYVELEVNDAAEIVMHRAVLVGDAGEIVDRDGLIAQFDGGFLQAASWAIHEQVTWDRDGITSRDWEGYPILRFDNVPEIETVLIERPGVPFLGAGEAVSGPAGAAIANAVCNATGIRLRRMPFTPDAIRAAALDA